jgi:hypothetical protein
VQFLVVATNLAVSAQDQRSMSSIQPSVDIFYQIDGAYKQPAKEGEEHDIEEFEEQENRGHPLALEINPYVEARNCNITHLKEAIKGLGIEEAVEKL